MIVMVPRDPESHGDLFRRDQSDLDGSFSLGTVIPSEYTIVAIENGWDLNWSQPGVIAHYTEKGQKVVIAKAGLRVWFDANEIKALLAYYSKTYPPRRATVTGISSPHKPPDSSEDLRFPAPTLEQERRNGWELCHLKSDRPCNPPERLLRRVGCPS
jgi:hypothetical protein